MTDLPSIYACLAAVKKEIGAVGKNQKNAAQNFNFRGVDAVVNAAAPALNDHGVITVPEVIGDPVYETVEVGSKRTPMAHVILKVIYHFYGPAGDSIAATVVSESMDSGDKAIAKAMSVAYRIALLQVLNLPTTEKDPDEDVFERSSRTVGAGPLASGSRPAQSRASKPAEPVAETPQQLADLAGKATTVEDLRVLYRLAGSKGWLKEKAVTPDGEPEIMENFLQNRNDDIARPKSTGAAGKGSGSGGS